MAVDPGNPRCFLRSTKWKKGMDGFFHKQPAARDSRRHRWLVTCPCQ